MEYINKIADLFRGLYGEEPELFHRLPDSGSNRIYYKIAKNNKTLLGAYNLDIRENRAFFYFTEHFKKQGLPVPEIFSVHPDEDVYLLEYLGDTTLYDYLTGHRLGQSLCEKTIAYYRQALAWLPKFQVEAAKGIDYGRAYPRYAFDRQSMQWDLNYFKYYFIKLSGIAFDEQRLEDDFQTLITFLLQAPSDYFLYRDFQSRNIMILHEKVYFIDYQGGRKGALQYDIVSLLWDAKADIPHEIREMLLESYLDNLSEFITVDREEFKKYYYVFVLIRILQALGTYGYRGFYERKAHFLQSIPYALNNLEWLFEKIYFPIDMPELTGILEKMIASPYLRHLSTQIKNKLTVTIHSFSYRKGIPYDPIGNGGGHVFDCRILPNPGKEIQFQHLTGCDKEVKEYLDKNQEAQTFFENTSRIVAQSVDNFLDRGFSNLMVSFGCTGGQHRSVYFAERMGNFLRENYPEINIIVHHNEQKQLNTPS